MVKGQGPDFLKVAAIALITAVTIAMSFVYGLKITGSMKRLKTSGYLQRLRMAGLI